MPSNTIEGLEIQFGNLGIGFGDSTSNSSSGVELQEDVPVVEVGGVRYNRLMLYIMTLILF